MEQTESLLSSSNSVTVTNPTDNESPELGFQSLASSSLHPHPDLDPSLPPPPPADHHHHNYTANNNNDQDDDKTAEPESNEEEEEEDEKLHQEIHNQLDLKEYNFKSDGWSDGEDNFNNGNNNGNENEQEDRSENGNNRSKNQYQYPVRPEAEDCAYYMKTGNCKFGSNCKFNHPVRRKTTQAAREKVKDREATAERPGQTECKYYLRTGGCKYGKDCRFNHSKAKTSVLPANNPVLPIAELNFLGLPIRQGERECPYYMRNGSCKYGANCRFNHPDPTAVGGNDPPVLGNGGSASLQGSSHSNVASWSSPRALNETATFVPVMFSPTQGVPSHSPEWNGYQAPPVYSPERGVHPPPAYVISSPVTETNVYAHQQQQMLVDEFPERPGQPECSYFMKTGDCKFKSNCKYHHPKNRISKSPPCALSDKGLPLRPDQNICSYYSRYGICKFGPACKFDHPVQSASSTGDDQPTSFGNSATKEEDRMAERGNESGTAT